MYAWHQEFGNDPAVELVIKTNHFANQEQKYNELSTWIEQRSEEHTSELQSH